MKKQQVDHILRAAGELTGEKQFVIIGSQSLHGKYPDLADDILRSFEVDLIAKNSWVLRRSGGRKYGDVAQGLEGSAGESTPW
jgi:hypothetical protein